VLVFVRFIGLPQVGEFLRLAISLQDQNDPTQLDRYKVLLYIDGFIVKIQRPDHAGDAYFCGRHGKSCDSINVQYEWFATANWTAATISSAVQRVRFARSFSIIPQYKAIQNYTNIFKTFLQTTVTPTNTYQHRRYIVRQLYIFLG
jgi:hypothetical protein